MPTTLTQVGIAKAATNGALRIETDDRRTTMHLAGYSVAALIMGRAAWGFYSLRSAHRKANHQGGPECPAGTG